MNDAATRVRDVTKALLFTKGMRVTFRSNGASLLAIDGRVGTSGYLQEYRNGSWTVQFHDGYVLWVKEKNLEPEWERK